MGSTTRYRAKIFSSTFDEVCSAHEESRHVRHQLGLTRELLLESAIEIHGQEYDEFMIILRNTDIFDFDEKVLFDMERSAKALEQALRHSGNKQAAQKLMDDVYRELVSTCRRLRRRKLPLSLSLIERKVQVMMSYIQKLEGSSLEHLLDIYEEGKEDLQFLIKAVSLGQKGTIITYQASIEESLGMAYIARKMFGEAIEAQLKAVELLESHEAIQPHVRLKPLGILAGLLCQVNRHSEAMPHFEKVIKMETKRLGKNHQSLGNHYLNRGICNFMAGNSSIARRDLLEAKRVYTANGMPHNSMELQRVRDFLHKIKVTGLSDEF
jgi:tetratricopeptide (TPR) repeat protein